MSQIAESYLSTKVEDVAGKFNALPKTGCHEKLENLPYYSNIGVDHVQGYTQYQNGDNLYFIFTHSLDSRESGRIVMIKNMKTLHKEIHTQTDWNHPGGIQAVGKYLFVPCEKAEKSIISVYDLDSSNLDKVKQIECSHKAGSLGITDFVISSIPYYLLLVGASSTYHAYISEIKSSAMAEQSFKKVGSFSLDNISGKKLDCQGFGLVTDTQNQVHMIALMPHASGATYADWGYLIKINPTTSGVNYEYLGQNRHFTNKGGVSGTYGSHFRWGAGIRVTPDGRLVILATSRNIIAGTYLNTTSWYN